MYKETTVSGKRLELSRLLVELKQLDPDDETAAAEGAAKLFIALAAIAAEQQEETAQKALEAAERAEAEAWEAVEAAYGLAAAARRAGDESLERDLVAAAKRAQEIWVKADLTRISTLEAVAAIATLP